MHGSGTQARVVLVSHGPIKRIKHNYSNESNLFVPYVGLWVGGVPDVQLGQWQECDFSRQVHFVELHQYFGADLVSLHNVIEQSGRREEALSNKEKIKRETRCRCSSFCPSNYKSRLSHCGQQIAVPLLKW